jgi:uncharacterized protein (DUF302 family)
MTQKAMTDRALALVLCLGLPLLAPGPAQAQTGGGSILQREGWAVLPTRFAFADLVRRLDEAVKANGMAVVNSASASEGAKAQGFAIPGNRVVGVYRNDFARRMLAASLAAGIEAPIRFYLTENADGTSTLSYRTPKAVFSPYFPEAGEDLRKVADELDAIFGRIASAAVSP